MMLGSLMNWKSSRAHDLAARAAMVHRFARFIPSVLQPLTQVQMLQSVSEQAFIYPALNRAIHPLGADHPSQVDAVLRDDVFNFDITFFAVEADLFVSQYFGHKNIPFSIFEPAISAELDISMS